MDAVDEVLPLTIINRPLKAWVQGIHPLAATKRGLNEMVTIKGKGMPFQKMLSSWPIRKKLLLVFACVFLPALALALVEGMSERLDVITKGEQKIITVVESMAAQQEHIATATRQLLGTLAQLPEVQQRDIEACNALFRRLNQQNPQYTNISMATPDGNMVASSLPFTPGSVNLSDRRHIREAIRTLDFSAGEYVMGRVSKVPSLNFTHPVIDGDGKLVAIVIAAFNLNEYNRYITRIKMPEGSAVAITDHQGIRLSRWPEQAAAAVGRPIPKVAFAQARGVSQGIYRQKSDDGINRIYAFKAMYLREGAPPYLFMFVGLDEGMLLHEANVRMIAQAMIVGLAGLMAAILIWFLVSLIIVRPIRSLSLATQNLGRGQRGVRTGLPHRADEIGQLADSFDTMAALLDAREKEREEAEVDLRTSEERLRTITDSAHDAILMMDSQGAISYWNPAAKKILGYRSEEALGKNLHEMLVPERYLAAYRTAFPEFQHSGFGNAIGKELELFAKRKDGQEIAVALSLSAVLLHGEWNAVGVLRDITERKRFETEIMQANKATHTANEVLSAIIESMSDWVWEVDAEGRYTYCSPQVETCLGYAPDEMIGKTPFYFMPPDEAKRIEGQFADIYRNKLRIQNLENWNITKEGRRILLSTSGVPIIDDAGNLTGYRGLDRDITVSRQMEEDLRRSRDHLAATMEAIPDILFEVDQDGNYLQVYAAREALLAAPANELVGKNIKDVLPAEAATIAFEALEAAGQKGTDYGRIIRLRLEQSEHWFELSVARKRTDVGKPPHFIALSRDITERMQGESALRSLSVATEQSPVSVVITDLEGTIQYVNPRFCEVTGYSAEEALGQNPKLLSSGLTKKSVIESLWNTLLQGHSWSGEFINKRKSGELFWEEAHITPVYNSKGIATQYVAVKMDITDRKLAELEIIKAKALAESATRAKSEFLANMSHEIRTPMNAIIGMADLLLDSPLTEEQSRYVNIFRNAGENLLRIINDILDFSKIEAGQVSLESITFSLHGLLKGTVEMMALKAAENEIGLSYTVPQDIDDELVGDPNRLRQILLNLVSNALKFTTVGSVHIAVERAENMAFDPAQSHDAICLRFMVKDTGVGIPPEGVEMIFDKFVQVDSSMSRKFGGSGLGLAICRQLVTLMDGKIWVESTEGVGSTFYFTVCLKKSRQAPSVDGEEVREPLPAAATDAKADRSLRILLVEDNEDNRLLILSYLKRLPHVVDVAGNGLEAVEKIREGGVYDLIFMDIQMPVMDGYTATGHIRDWEREHDLRPAVIIALTAHALQDDEQKSIDAGCDGHLAKPIRKQDFLSAVQSFAGGLPSI